MRHIRPGLRAADRLILTRVAQFDGNEPDTTTLPVADLTDEQLTAEYSRVRDRGTELSSIADRQLTADESAELSVLAERAGAVTAEQASRTAAATQLQANRDLFASMPEPVAPAAVEPPAPVTPPATEPAPVVPPAVTAATTPPAVPSVTAMEPAAPPVAPAGNPQGTVSVVLTSDGAGALGLSSGTEVDMRTLARSVARSFQAYGHAAKGGQTAQRAIAQFSRPAREFELTRQDSDSEVIDRIRRENRLEGGSLLSAFSRNVEQGQSLTAAAGWCAPSENLYDVCGLWSMDGMLDLPTATARRGGFNYFSNVPTYADMDASTSFTILTEAQVIADTAKNCAELPCPTPTDTRLDVAVSCITASFLQMAGFPEWVENYVDGLLTNHAHKLNENIIGRIVTKAGAATVIPAQGVVTGTGGAGLGADTSAVASVLAAVDLARTDMVYRERMARNATFEVILPMWVLTQFRSDVVRKNGWDPANAALADATILGWFAVRNIRPQFVYDWQDAYSGLATGPGDSDVLTALPATANFLIYPAGAVVLARQDVVTLSNVYDSANLQQNLFTRLFSEEGFNLLYPCGSIRQYTTQVCPSGATAAQAYTGCIAPATGA